jgi:hypothetical protein
MPIAISSHGRIALTMVILGLRHTTDHSLLELGCLTCARRGSDALAFATLTERAFGKLLSVTSYLAQRAVIRTIAAAGPMRLRAAMSAYHRLRISVLLSKSVTNRFSLQIVLRGLANPPGSVDVIPTAGCAQCARCSLLTFVRAWALGALF